MDSFTEAVANLLRIHRADFHVCRSQFKSFKSFNRFAPFITGISPFQLFQSFQPLRSVQIVSEKTAKTLIRDESAGHGFYLAG
jgi:hypothetical protein